MGPLLLLPDEILDQNMGPQHKKDLELLEQTAIFIFLIKSYS